MENKILLQELVKQNLISENVSKKLLQEAALIRRSAEDLIYERRLIDEEKLADVKSRLLGVPYKKVKAEEISEEVLKSVSEEAVRNYKIVPINKTAEMLVVGMLNPDDSNAQDALKFIAKQSRINLGVYLIAPSVWESVLRRYSPYRSEIDAAIKSLKIEGKGYSQVVRLEETAGAGSEDAPIIKIVATTLKEAVWQKASDIHIEPQRNRMRIRFRIDGELQEVSSMP